MRPRPVPMATSYINRDGIEADHRSTSRLYTFVLLRIFHGDCLTNGLPTWRGPANYRHNCMGLIMWDLNRSNLIYLSVFGDIFIPISRTVLSAQILNLCPHCHFVSWGKTFVLSALVQKGLFSQPYYTKASRGEEGGVHCMEWFTITNFTLSHLHPPAISPGLRSVYSNVPL